MHAVMSKIIELDHLKSNILIVEDIIECWKCRNANAVVISN